MKKVMSGLVLAAAMAVSAQAQLVFYNFGPSSGFDLTVNEDLLPGTPTITQSGGSIDEDGAAGTSFTDFSGTSWTAGSAMAWDNGVNDTPANGFTFAFNSTGYENFVVRFDYRATSTGPASFSAVEYNVGSGFVTLSGAVTSLTNDSAYYAWSYDLSSLSVVENVASVQIRWLWSAGTSTGTSQIDNFQLTGSAIPEPFTYALLGLGLASLMLLRRKAGK